MFVCTKQKSCRWIGWLKKLKLLQKEDKEEWDAIDRKNQADSVLYQTRSDKKSWETMFLVDKEKVEAKVNEVMDAIPGGSTQAIKYAMAVLNQEIM